MSQQEAIIAGHVNPDMAAHCEGAIEAQQALDAILEGQALPSHAWLRFVELAVRRGGWKSPACRAFLIELAKRAGGGMNRRESPR